MPVAPFEVDPWLVVERGIDDESLAVAESVLTLSNGYPGVRDVLDEGEPSRERGTFLAGLYETHPLS